MNNTIAAHRYAQPLSDAANALLNDTMRTILARASCRQFSGRKVSDATLEALFAVAFSAPSKSDLQQVSVIHIGDRSLQRQIATNNSATHWIAEAPVFMVWCGDNRRMRRVSELRQHPFRNDHLDTFMNTAVDAAIAMQTFILAAESHGLGCCPISQVRDSIHTLSEQLKLPSYVFPVAALCLGWPAQTTSVSMRLPNQVTVHKNHYDDSQLLDTVKRYDRQRGQQDKTPDTAQRLTDHFGISEDYGWSEDHARQYALPMRTDFGAYIRKQGFNLN